MYKTICRHKNARTTNLRHTDMIVQYVWFKMSYGNTRLYVLNNHKDLLLSIARCYSNLQLTTTLSLTFYDYMCPLRFLDFYFSSND